MEEGNRVKLSEEGYCNSALTFETRGTVLRVSPAGYKKILWDDGSVSHFSPASLVLIVVSGEDAMPRHVWTGHEEDPCRRCHAVQTDANYLGPCNA